MDSSHRFAAAAFFGVALFGCSPPRRVANSTMVGSVVLAPISTGGEVEDGQTVGGLHGLIAGADTEEEVSYYLRGELGIGGNANGALLHQSLDAQLGLVAFDGADHLFARAGLRGVIGIDPLSTWMIAELPSLWLGYQHHGEDHEDSTHFDIGPRVSLALGGTASAGGSAAPLVAAPGAGAAALFMGELVFLSVSVMTYFEARPVLVAEGTGCLAGLLALCVDIRHIEAELGPQRSSFTYVGLHAGVGMSTGLSHSTNFFRGLFF